MLIITIYNYGIVPDRSLTYTCSGGSVLPSQPTWFHRLPEILDELRILEAAYLDRLAVEKLFGVAERRARQLMAGLPGLLVGNAFAVERLALIARFEQVAAGDAWRHEVSRRTRLTERLGDIRQQAAARRVRIPAAANVRERRLGDLPVDISLRPGELRIEFFGAEDLAAKLFELSQAMANDWPAFSRAVEEDIPSPPRPSP